MIPVLPFLALQGSTAVAASVALSTIGLFTIGSAITLFTGRSILYSGVRQVLFGLAGAAVVFCVGRLVGVSLAG